MKIYALKNKDGSVSVMRLYGEDCDVEQELDKWGLDENGDKVRDQVISYREITEDQIPSDRESRDAWTDDMDSDTIDVCPKRKAKFYGDKK